MGFTHEFSYYCYCSSYYDFIYFHQINFDCYYTLRGSERKYCLKGKMTDEPKVILTCDSWTLNVDADSGDNFWWNDSYSLSVWEKCLKLDKNSILSETDVWRAYIEFQLGNVFKVCTICHIPEEEEDLKICCYCANCIHPACSVEALQENIDYKPGNKGFESHLRICFSCESIPFEPSPVPKEPRVPESARRAVLRLLSLSCELPAELYHQLELLRGKIAKANSASDKYMKDLADAAVSFFQTPQSLQFLEKRLIPCKGGGVGVVAKKDIPAFSVVGVYPGYNDFLSGEHSKIGRPVAKYALMDLNCANYYNKVFPEFSGTFTPFINEPLPNEKSNCAWIQEPHHALGRLSIITVKSIKKGEELLIGYGPVYPRDYPYCYDAYAFHRAGDYSNPICFALWHWPTLEEKDSRFVCYVAYLSDSREYIQWEEEK